MTFIFRYTLAYWAMVLRYRNLVIKTLLYEISARLAPALIYLSWCKATEQQFGVFHLQKIFDQCRLNCL